MDGAYPDLIRAALQGSQALVWRRYWGSNEGPWGGNLARHSPYSPCLTINRFVNYCERSRNEAVQSTLENGVMTQFAPLTVTSLYAGIAALLLVVVSILVTAARVKHKVNIGDGGKPEMLTAIRRQGNLVEYAPMTIILMALLELGGTAPWLLHVLGIAFIVGRLMHASVDLSARPGALRGIGTTVTWIVIAAGGVLTILLTAGISVK
jgi:uncharacterized protein